MIAKAIEDVMDFMIFRNKYEGFRSCGICFRECQRGN